MSTSEPHSQRPVSWSGTVLKRQLLAVGVASAVLAAVVVVLYLQNRKYEKGLREQQGQHRIDVAAEFVSRQIGAVRSDLLYLAEQQALRRFLTGREEARAAIENEYSRFVRRKAIYDQIRCLDTSGKETVRVNFRNGRPQVVSGPDLQHKEERYYFRKALALKRGEVFVSDFDLNVEHGAIEHPLKPVIRFATPVFDEAGRKRGILILNYLGSQLLARVNEVSLPGSTLLLNSDGEYLRGLRPDDAWGWLLGHQRSFAHQFPDAWRRLRRNADEEIHNQEGLFVVRRIALSEHRPAGAPASENETGPPPDADRGTSLILVSYLPADEVYAASGKLLWQLLLMAAGAMLPVAILSRYWAHNVAIRKDQERRIAESEARLRALSTELLAAQEAERRSISREIHDELGQQVTAITLDLQLATRQHDSERGKSLLLRAIGETEQLLKSLHQIASQLRPAVLDDLGFREAIQSCVSEFRQRTGIAVDADLRFGARSVPSRIGENAYRVVQEALTNVAKHAGVDRVRLSVQAESDTLCISVTDDGAGFDPDRTGVSRLGILGMRERAELLGGEFRLESAPGRGTRLSVTFPLAGAS